VNLSTINQEIGARAARDEAAPASNRRRLPAASHLLLPVAAAGTAWAAFHAGGYFPDGPGVLAAALAVLLLLRVTLAAAPFASWTASATVAAGAGALLATWMLASALWSDAPARALFEMHRLLAYGLAFALMATVPRRPGTLAALLRWVLVAFAVVAAAGLATRVFPDVFHTIAGRQPSRLAYPLTYWNAMGVFCGLGAVLALHVASSGTERAWARISAGAVLPVIAVAGYFPVSRGGIGTAVIGAVLYLVLARPRRLLFTLLTAGPPTAVALLVAYHSDALATDTYFRGDGPAEGHRLALVVLGAVAAAAVLRLLVLPLERRVDAIRDVGRRGWRRAALGVAVLVVIAGAVAVDAPARIHTEYRAFVEGNVVQEGTDVRSRLTAVGNNGRLDIWRVDADAIRAEPLHGTGAGTFAVDWTRWRRGDNQVVDGHSLYLETYAELGIVGLVLLGVLIVALLWGPARGLRGPDRHAHAAVLAAGVALLLHAAIDWDWEMPALFLWLFAAAGLAAARPWSPALAEARGPGRVARVAAGLCCLVLAVTPVLAVGSEHSLRRAAAAFDRGDCRTAVDGALSSIDALGVRADPFELLGYCDLRLGAAQLGVRAMQGARSRDPDNWRYAYGLALARARAGQDPRPAAQDALRLNPHEPLARTLVRRLRRNPPREWPAVAARSRLPVA
jgi:O-Antigen ligase